MHRDSYATFLSYLAPYAAVAEGESIGRVRYTMAERMLMPCGPPPPAAAAAAGSGGK
jgi:splicing factor 3B subunit 5